MRAKISGECLCGFPGVTANVTRVRMQGKQIIACEACTPALSTEVELDEPRLWTVQLIGRKYESGDGTWFVYQAKLAEPHKTWMPPAIRTPFALKGGVGVFIPGEIITVYGALTQDAKHGWQIETLAKGQQAILSNEQAFISFLSRLPNIGQQRSIELIQKLGGFERVIEALDTNPEKLLIC